MCAFIAMHVHKRFEMLEKPTKGASNEKKSAYREDSLQKQSKDNLICTGV